jgi:hypothetical protein
LVAEAVPGKQELTRQLTLALAPVFKRRGWRKQSLNWFRTEADTILVFHAGRNRWGANRYSFTCGVYLKALGSESTPPFYRCPVQAPLFNIAPDRDLVERLENFDDPSLSTSERLIGIASVVDSVAVPWLEQHSTLAGLRTLVSVPYDDLLPRVHVWRAPYDYLRSGAAN